VDSTAQLLNNWGLVLPTLSTISLTFHLERDKKEGEQKIETKMALKQDEMIS